MKYFGNFILYPLVRPFVLLFFGLTLTGSIIIIFRLQIGLNQNLALPKVLYSVHIRASVCVHVLYAYMYTYSYMYVHAQVYMYIHTCTCICICENISPPSFHRTLTSFLISTKRLSTCTLGLLSTSSSKMAWTIYTVEGNQNKICSGSGCNDNSLGNLITIYARALKE